MITPLFFLLLLRLLSQGLPCILLAWPVFPLSLGKSLRHIPSGRRNHIALLSPPFISDMRYMASTLFIYIGYTIHLRYATIQIRLLRYEGYVGILDPLLTFKGAHAWSGACRRDCKEKRREAEPRYHISCTKEPPPSWIYQGGKQRWQDHCLQPDFKGRRCPQDSEKKVYKNLSWSLSVSSL